jgi:hypothetical protein
VFKKDLSPYLNFLRFVDFSFSIVKYFSAAVFVLESGHDLLAACVSVILTVAVCLSF